MSQHTPGPMPIILVGNTTDDPRITIKASTFGEAEYLKSLIAAAPEMLETIENLLPMAEAAYNRLGMMDPKYLDRARAVLTKVVGETRAKVEGKGEGR